MAIPGFPQNLAMGGVNPLIQPLSGGSSCPSCPQSGGGGASPFGAPSPVFPGMNPMQGGGQGMQGIMSGDTMSLFMGLQGMMLGLMGMVTTLLMGLLSGSISGSAPAGSGNPGATGGMPGTGPGTDSPGSPGGSGNPMPNTSGGGGVPAGDSTPAMQRLAQTARSSGGAMNKPGWCLGGVQTTLREFGGPTIPPLGSAYRAADYMAGKPDQFEEVSGVSKDQLRNLGPGYIVVYERGGSGAIAEHGHIYITLGGGKEASSTTRDIFDPPAGFRVFKIKN